MYSNILIVGAGISGITIARILANNNLTVTIIDKRNHIGGNCYDYRNEHNILIHKYGPHLFHTSDIDVFSFLSNFTDWTDYFHKVKALLHDGRFVDFPVNKNTLAVVPKEEIAQTFFIPYTKKMWGLNIEDLNVAVLSRIPVRSDTNDLYFPNDKIQKLPTAGYTEMFKNMLNHPNISLKLNTPFSNEMLKRYDYIFNSMPIDEFFNFKYGELPYRSIKFHNYTLPIPRIYPAATINFTNNSPFTRVTEWKILPNSPTSDENKFFTSLTIEEPCDYKENNFERYYPVNDSKNLNHALYERYLCLTPSNIKFIGRCGLYKYLNMDIAVREAMNIANSFLSSSSKNA